MSPPAGLPALDAAITGPAPMHACLLRLRCPHLAAASGNAAPAAPVVRFRRSPTATRATQSGGRRVPGEARAAAAAQRLERLRVPGSALSCGQRHVHESRGCCRRRRQLAVQRSGRSRLQPRHEALERRYHRVQVLIPSGGHRRHSASSSPRHRTVMGASTLLAVCGHHSRAVSDRRADRRRFLATPDSLGGSLPV
jgi:hypothetical protein